MWLPVLSAVLGWVAFSPVNAYPVAFVFIAPLFVFFMREKSLLRLIAGAFVFRFFFSLGIVPFALEPISWFSSLAIFCGLPIIIFTVKKITDAIGASGRQTIIIATSLPFLWTIFDIAEARFSLLPTFDIAAGTALGQSPFVGLAALGGFTTLTFFVALANVLCAAFIIESPKSSDVLRPNFWGVCVLIFSAFGVSYYALHANASAYFKLPRSVSVAAITADRALTAANLDSIADALSNERLDLIVLPENPFGEDGHAAIAEWQTNSVTQSISSFARKSHANVLAGLNTLQDDESGARNNRYNSAILVGETGDIIGIHNKRRLTFVGEYWPFGDWVPRFYSWVVKKNPAIETYAVFDPRNADAVGDLNLLALSNDVRFAAPICLEIHYPSDLAAYRDAGSSFIATISNNSWIISAAGKKSFSHLVMNMRRIESVSLRVPIVASGVNDVAGIFFPDGRMDIVSASPNADGFKIATGTIRY